MKHVLQDYKGMDSGLYPPGLLCSLLHPYKGMEALAGLYNCCISTRDCIPYVVREVVGICGEGGDLRNTGPQRAGPTQDYEGMDEALAGVCRSVNRITL